MWELLVWFLPICAVVSFALGYYFQWWWQKWRAARQINTVYLDIQDDKLQNLHNQEVVDKLLGAVDQIIIHNMAIEPAQLIDRVVLQAELEQVKATYLAQQGERPEQQFTAAPKAINQTITQIEAIDKHVHAPASSATTPSVVVVHTGSPEHLVQGKVITLAAQEPTQEPSLATQSGIELLHTSQADQTTLSKHVEKLTSELSVEADIQNTIDLANQALSLALDPKSSQADLENLEHQLGVSAKQGYDPVTPRQAQVSTSSSQESLVSNASTSTTVATDTYTQPLVVRSSQDLAYHYAVLPSDVAHLLELQLVAALIWRQRGDFMKAINIYRHVLAVPTWKGVGHQRAQLDLARCYLQAGMFHKVTELLTPLLDSEVYAAQAMRLLLYFHQVSHNWKEGLAIAKRNYTKFKTKTNLHLLYHFYHQRLLECYHEIGHRRTMYAFQRLLELHNPHVRTLWMRGNYHFVHEDYTSALADYKSLVAQRIELLPDLIGNIACCFAMLREVGNNLGLFLRDLLRRHPDLDYVLVIYDLYLQQYNFTQHAFGFEFTGKEKNLHELFHNLHSQMTEQLFAQDTIETHEFDEQDLAPLEPISASDVNYKSSSQTVTSATNSSSAAHAPRSQLHRQLYAKPKILDKLADLIDREAKFRYDVVIYTRLQRLLTWQQRHYSRLVAQQLNALLTALLMQMPEQQMHQLLQYQMLADGKLKLRSSLEHNQQQQQAIQQSSQQFTTFAQQQQNLELEAVYSCRNCGYTQRHVFWYCQACQKWETVYLKDTQLKQKQR